VLRKLAAHDVDRFVRKTARDVLGKRGLTL